MIFGKFRHFGNENRVKSPINDMKKADTVSLFWIFPKKSTPKPKILLSFRFQITFRSCTIVDFSFINLIDEGKAICVLRKETIKRSFGDSKEPHSLRCCSEHKKHTRHKTTRGDQGQSFFTTFQDSTDFRANKNPESKA